MLNQSIVRRRAKLDLLALSVSDRPWRKWALRSMAGFLLVYMAGAFGVPTLILSLAIQNRRADDLPPPPESDTPVRRETIH
jgi:hypothetical protein